jgi:hypothetical protein
MCCSFLNWSLIELIFHGGLTESCTLEGWRQGQKHGIWRQPDSAGSAVQSPITVTPRSVFVRNGGKGQCAQSHALA